eukprot:CAMPEP_0202705164 /NCGR_PEP_ID=MMETSP1385-20130828/17750_1 /ASSEMBLY_ACC=CAM_ASM_000861 /TAXON_ID=933848 /ORGANISM="Elphidium margaritaceum" /LENGTH=395 /DNA_ID=CAMNT_0049363341 /DNA_START=36 /DNA_END=1223 /DNA_ORIENTATION=+
MAYGRAYDDEHPWWHDDHNQTMQSSSHTSPHTVSFHGSASSTVSHHGVHNGTPFRSAYDDEEDAYSRYTNKSRATSNTQSRSTPSLHTTHPDTQNSTTQNIHVNESHLNSRHNRKKQTQSFAVKTKQKNANNSDACDEDDGGSDAMYKRYKSSVATSTNKNNVSSQRRDRTQLRNKYRNHASHSQSSQSRKHLNQRPVLQTMEEQKQYQEQLREKTKSHLDESLRTAFQSEEIAADTSQKLYNQGEQLQNIGKMLHETDENLDRTEHTLQGMKSIWGGIRNVLFKKPPPKKTYIDPLSTVSAVKRETSSTSGMQSGTAKLSTGSKVSLGGSEKDDHEFNSKLDELHDSVKRMRVMAETMNEELDDQNVLLTHIDDKMDPMAQRIRKQNQTMKRIR